MTIAPQLQAPLNTIPPYIERDTKNPTVGRRADFIGQELYVQNTNSYWKFIGFINDIGYIWVQIEAPQGGSGTGLSWYTVAGAGTTMVANAGYYIDSPSLVSISIATTGFALGDIIQIICSSTSGGVSIALQGSQIISFGTVSTSAAGTFSSDLAGSTITLTCVVANSVWAATGSTTSSWTLS